MRDRVTRRLIGLAVTLAACVWGTHAGAGGVAGNLLEIVSPAKGYVTGEPTLDVTIRVTTGRGVPGHAGRLLSAVVLTAAGQEVARLDLAAPATQAVHTFVLDLTGHPERVMVLQAHGVAGGRRIATSSPVSVRINRNASNGVMVGPAGGVLRSGDGALTLTVPEGALSDWKRIVARPADAVNLPPLAPGVTAAFAYELRPHGLQFARPVDVAVRLPGSAGGGGPGGHAPVIMLNRSGADVEALGDQRLVVDLVTGDTMAQGRLRHFSSLFGVLLDEVSVRVDGIPDVAEVGEAFIATATVTDTENVVLSGVVEYTDAELFRLRRVEPSTADEPAVILGTLRPSVPDTLSRELIYVCTEFGMGMYRARARLVGRVIVFGPFSFESVAEFVKPVFCHAAEGTATSPESFPAGIRTSIAPLDAGRRVGESVDIELREHASRFPASAGASVEVSIVDLSPGVLSEVSALSPAELRLQSEVDRVSGLPGHRFSVSLESDVEQRQTLRYTCLTSGTTTLRFTFAYSFIEDRRGIGYVETLLATVSCGDGGRAPVVTSSPPTAAVVGVVYTYDVEAEDPEGHEVTYSLADAPLGMRIDFQTGEITWTPGAGQVRSHQVVVLVADAAHVVEQRYTVTVDGDGDGDGTGDAEDACPTSSGSVRGCSAVVELENDVDVYCASAGACAGLTASGGACADCSIVHEGVTADCQSRPGATCTFQENGMLATTGGMLMVSDALIDCTDARCMTYGPETFLCEGGPARCLTTYADSSQTQCPGDRGCSSFVMPVALDPGLGVRALLRIDKVTEGGDGTFVFDVGRPGGASVAASITTQNGVGTTAILVNAERASVLDVLEDPQPGWEADQPDCDASWLMIDAGAIAIGFDGPTTCTFTNRRIVPTTVPLVFGLMRAEAEALIVAAGLVVGTVVVNDHSALPPGTVEAQSLEPFSSVPRGTPVDLVIAGGGQTGALVVLRPERLTNVAADAFAVGSANTTTVAGSNGFAAVDVLTGEVVTSRLDEGPWFGAIVVRNELDNGEDAVLRYGPSSIAVNIFHRALGQFGITQLGLFAVLDASHAGGHPGAPVVIQVGRRDVLAARVLDVGFGAFLGGPVQPVASASSLPGIHQFVSAFAYDLLRLTPLGELAADSSGWVLAITDGAPGRAWLLNPRTPSAEGLLVGEVGHGPRTLRCLQSHGICVVVNFLSRTATIILWDGQSTATIAGHVAIDDGAVTGDLRPDGSNVALLTSGFESNTATKTTLAPDGGVVSAVTRAVSAACQAPAHALWIWGTRLAALSCNQSDSLEVFEWP
jgi:hypothetical protein